MLDFTMYTTKLDIIYFLLKTELNRCKKIERNKLDEIAELV